MWPAIFLPLNTRPGVWHWPIEPGARWEIELYGQLGTDFRRLIGVFQAELPQTNTRFDTRLGEMSRLGFTHF